RQRRVLVPPLKGERMRAFFDAMRSATREEIRTWPRGQVFPMLPPMRRITLRVISQTVLGLQAGPELLELEDKIERVLVAGRMSRYSIAMFPFVPVKFLANKSWAPFFGQLRRLDEALYAFVRKRREAPPEGTSLFADLLAARHEDGQPLSD